MKNKKIRIFIIVIIVIFLSYFIINKIHTKKLEKEAKFIYNKSVDFLDKNNFYNAMIGFNTIVKKYPKTKYCDLAFRKLIIIMNEHYCNYEEAIKLCEIYYKKFPTTIFTDDALYIIANNKLYFGSDFPGAKKYLNIITKRYKNSDQMYKVLNALSFISNSEKNYAEVIKNNNLLITNFPDKVSADNLYLNNVDAYYRLGQVENAYLETYKIKNIQTPEVQENLPYLFTILTKAPSKEIYLKIIKVYEKLGLKNQVENYKKMLLTYNKKKQNKKSN